MGWRRGQSLVGIFQETMFLDNHINIIPVDIAARDCISMIKEDETFSIRHSCFTGNNPHCISYFHLYTYLLEAYDLL